MTENATPQGKVIFHTCALAVWEWPDGHLSVVHSDFATPMEADHVCPEE